MQVAAFGLIKRSLTFNNNTSWHGAMRYYHYYIVFSHYTPAKYIKLEDLLNKYYVFPPFVLINSLYLHNQYMLYRTIGIITNH